VQSHTALPPVFQRLLPTRRLLVLASLFFALPVHAAPMFVPLGALPGAEVTEPSAISADGSTVVGNGFSEPFPGDGSTEAFRWTQAGGMQGLGFLPGKELSASTAVSADGSTVAGVGWGNSGDDEEAFRWTQAGGMQSLGFLPGAGFSRSVAVSADGSTIAGRSGSEAFRWTQAGAMQGLGVLAGATSSEASALSADGSTVVGSSSNWTGSSTTSTQEAFRWTESGGMQGLGLLPGWAMSYASAVSADGSTVVGEGNCCGSAEPGEAFRWTQAGGMQSLGFLPGADASTALGLSADGSVVGGNSLGGTFFQEAFRWTQADGIQGLGVLAGGTFSYVAAVSGDGSTIVGESDAGGQSETFIWDATHGMRELDQVLTSLGLDLEGWTLNGVIGISFDGQTLAGGGTDPTGQDRLWLAVIPEPGTGLLVMTGVMGIAASRRRRAS